MIFRHQKCRAAQEGARASARHTICGKPPHAQERARAKRKGSYHIKIWKEILPTPIYRCFLQPEISALYALSFSVDSIYCKACRGKSENSGSFSARIQGQVEENGSLGRVWDTLWFIHGKLPLLTTPKPLFQDTARECLRRPFLI